MSNWHGRVISRIIKQFKRIREARRGSQASRHNPKHASGEYRASLRPQMAAMCSKVSLRYVRAFVPTGLCQQAAPHSRGHSCLCRRPHAAAYTAVPPRCVARNVYAPPGHPPPTAVPCAATGHSRAARGRCDSGCSAAHRRAERRSTWRAPRRQPQPSQQPRRQLPPLSR